MSAMDLPLTRSWRGPPLVAAFRALPHGARKAAIFAGFSHPFHGWRGSPCAKATLCWQACSRASKMMFTSCLSQH